MHVVPFDIVEGVLFCQRHVLQWAVTSPCLVVVVYPVRNTAVSSGDATACDHEGKMTDDRS